MNAKKCDRCKVLYEEYNAKSYDADPNCLGLYQGESGGIYYLLKRIDLCPECMAKLQEWLKGDETDG